MRITDIEMYRDGGSIEFRVERDGKTNHVWLETPFAGEPRALRIDSIAISRGAAEVFRLMDDIQEWWESLPSALQGRALEALAHTGAFYNPTGEMMEAIDVSRVLRVRDYVSENHAA
ncbi:MAG: hypothetical protein OER90_03165 [Gemmatimonadota bacterium]|nr:hypothetical protein [Gemmatimonadota bacterium]